MTLIVFNNKPSRVINWKKKKGIRSQVIWDIRPSRHIWDCVLFSTFPQH